MKARRGLLGGEAGRSPGLEVAARRRAQRHRAGSQAAAWAASGGEAGAPRRRGRAVAGVG